MRSYWPPPLSPSLPSSLLPLCPALQDTKDEVLELRQDASDLQEYSNAKLTRVSRYLAVLGEKARKLGRHLPHSLLRPDTKDEVLELRQDASDLQEYSNAKLTRVSRYLAVLGEKARKLAHLFQDIQPFVQAVLDGYNACVIAYGQTGTGKTHTMEGPSHDRGVYFRAFDELFDLSNITSSMQPTSQCTFHIRDLMRKQCDTGSSPRMHHEIQETEGGGVHVAGLHEEPVETPAEFNRAMRIAAQHKNSRKLRSHIMIIVHVKQTDLVTGEKLRSKLYMVDLAGSERLSGRSDTSGDRLTESLHINKSLSALGDCMSALTSKKGTPPYYNSKLTHILSDTMGGEAKTLLVVHCSPNARDAPESIASLNFAARARNVEISLGSKDTIKKWRDMANDARKEVYEKDKQLEEQHAEVAKLRQHLADAADERAEVARLRGAVASYEAEAEDQRAEVDLLHEALAESRRQVEAMQRTCSDAQQRAGLLSAELQEAHTFSASLEDDVHAYSDRIHRLQVEAAEQAERQRKVRQEHEALLASQRGQLEDAFRTRQEKLLAERHATVAALERLHKENETLFNRISAPPREHVPQSPITRSISQPSINSPPTGNGSPRRDLPPQANGAQTGGSYRGLAPSLPLVIPESPTPDAGGQLSQASTPGSTRSRGGSVIVRTDSTPAGEYLTSGLADFNPDSFSSKVVAGDAANKLLMLVMAAASKAGPDRETEILQELQDPVVEFIRTTGTKVPLDPMLVTRVRLLYLRQLLRGKPKELQDVQVHPVEAFLEPASASGAAAPSHAARPSLQQQQQGGGRESDGGGEEPVARSLRMNLQAFRPEKKPARGVFGSKVMPNSPKVLQEMQYDTLILSNTEATRQLYSSEEPRIASLKALEEILADILREAPVHGSAALKRVAQLQKLQVGAAARLTPVDSAVGEAAISRAQKHLMASGSSSSQAKLSRRASTTGTADTGGMSREVFPPGGAPGVPEQLNGETIYWTLVQFNNKQGTAPVVVKCGATSKLDLVVKMVKQKDAKGVAAGLSQLPDSVSLMCVPAVLNDMSMNEINAELQDLPEALRVLALSKTASGTRARYARLYKTLAGRVPSMRSGLGMELDDMGTPGAFSRENSIPSTPQKSPSREPGALPRGTSLPVRNEELF
eukprot:jgi/Mesen1/3781/ME000205S03043